MPIIKELKGREVLDSRGKATVEALCVLMSGAEGLASVPSGVSTGVHEAAALEAGKAIENIEGEIALNLAGKEFDQESLDEALITLDGTGNKSRLGANATLAVSYAFARAVAAELKLELFEYIGRVAGNTKFDLPVPAFNIIEGGKHSESGLEIQEFWMVPSGIKGFREKVSAAEKVIEGLKEIIVRNGNAVSYGAEGGFAPQLSSNEEAIQMIEEAIKSAGYNFDEIKIGLDAAASSFYKNGLYEIEGQELDSIGLLKWYEGLASKHPLMAIEDGFAEDDWEGFVEMRKILGDKILIIGDDLLCTNTKRIDEAIEKRAVNSVLIKPNQIGTLTEAFGAVALAKKAGMIPFVSHRAGETFDTFISDFAVGLGCGFIKAGSLTQPEKSRKYERLIEIETL